MKILVCNDDGIYAAGLKALCKVLVMAGHEISVLAPDKERSANGHALTLYRPLRVESMPKDFIPSAKEIFTVDGTPADCVKIAITKILKFRPDWVLSGINHGPNLGSDIVYSGTVSAAIEGGIYGIKSCAFSISEYKNDDFDLPAQYVIDILNLLCSQEFELPDKTIFNVNIPIVPREKLKGIALTKLGSRMYKDNYEERIDPRGRFYYWLSGDLMKTDKDVNSDISCLSRNYISITPLCFDMTSCDFLSKFKKTKFKLNDKTQ